MVRKAEALIALIKALTKIRLQHSIYTHSLQTDKVAECKSRDVIKEMNEIDVSIDQTLANELQQNSIAVRRNHTVGKAAKCTLHQAKRYPKQWHWTDRDETIKCNFMPHSSTGRTSLKYRNSSTCISRVILPFGCKSKSPATTKPTEKWSTKARERTFLCHTNHNYITAMVRSSPTAKSKIITIRFADFQMLHSSIDSTQTTAAAFSTTIATNPDTAAPRKRGHATIYTDAAAWECAQNEQLDKLIGMKSIEWLNAQDVSEGVKIVPLTMT